ncbi:MAG: transketolase family protein, partial [Eubacteriales bacterium]|nr:transketolase family protein [Eubacteriales bacterium]
MSEKLIYGCSLKGFRATLAETLEEIGRENGNLIVVDAETGTATNAIAFKEKFPDRYITCGIAEQAAVSFAFALSRCGKVPVVPLFSCFLARRACDQVYIQIGYAQANVKLVGCYSGMTTPNTGATHQSINDIAIMRSVPGMRVIETADPFEFAQALREAVSCRGPV